jgi:hypothetical protein
MTIARLTLNDAVRDVVMSDPATQRLIDEYNAAQRRFVDLRRAMEFLDGRGLPFKFYCSEEA